MVMFKAKFTPTPSDKPVASSGERRQLLQRQQQQQPQPQPRPVPPHEEEDKAPPIEKEQGPQTPVKLPGEPHEPMRAR